MVETRRPRAVHSATNCRTTSVFPVLPPVIAKTFMKILLGGATAAAADPRNANSP